MNKSLPKIQNLPFTPEVQKKLNGDGVIMITFSNHTILKFLVPCEMEDCNVVSFDIGRMITYKELELLSLKVPDIYATLLEGATYGMDIFNLSRNRLNSKDFIIYTNKIAEALLNILDQDILVYQSKNHMFYDGFTEP